MCTKWEKSNFFILKIEIAFSCLKRKTNFHASLASLCNKFSTVCYNTTNSGNFLHTAYFIGIPNNKIFFFNILFRSILDLKTNTEGSRCYKNKKGIYKSVY